VDIFGTGAVNEGVIVTESEFTEWNIRLFGNANKTGLRRPVPSGNCRHTMFRASLQQDACKPWRVVATLSPLPLNYAAVWMKTDAQSNFALVSASRACDSALVFERFRPSGRCTND
jgi:hypothetical protein